MQLENVPAVLNVGRHDHASSMQAVATLGKPRGLLTYAGSCTLGTHSLQWALSRSSGHALSLAVYAQI